VNLGRGASRARARRGARLCAVFIVAVCLACATPIGVRRVDPRNAYRANTESVLTSETPSVGSRQVLLRLGLFDRFPRDPVGVLRALHERTLAEMIPDQLFALAEYSELHAERSGDNSYHVAAALYAFAFLFPDDGTSLPDALDPRTRTAASLYNRAVANALIGKGNVASFAPLALPPHVGRIETSFDEEQLRWAGRRLVDFVPAMDLEVWGLRNRYRRAGIGAPFSALLAAEPGAELDPMDKLISERVRIPVSVLLRFESARAGLRDGEQRSTLEVHNSREEDDTALLAGRPVPVEYETSVALALSLNGSPIWDSGIAGFRNPVAVAEGGTLQLLGPHRRGRIPVVFVHGTASSVVRWAEMLNELDSDPAIRKHYEFWLFSYPTGVPILYSASLLRQWLNRVVTELDPDSTDDSLRQMVLVGHSQGGLVAKLQVISSGTRFWDDLSDVPFDRIELQPETRDLLRESMFFEPAPFVSSVIFIATPQRGSFLAASWPGRLATRLTQAPGHLVSLPMDLARAGIALPGMAVDLVTGEMDEMRVQRALGRIPTSVDNMDPSSLFIRTLAEIRIEPPIVAHSIIPVLGGPPPEGQSDGVVSFESSRIEGARSELVVFNTGHSVQSHPEAIQEVRRILLERIFEAR
jgi:hypothetical protein